MVKNGKTGLFHGQIESGCSFTHRINQIYGPLTAKVDFYLLGYQRLYEIDLPFQSIDILSQLACINIIAIVVVEPNIILREIFNID